MIDPVELHARMELLANVGDLLADAVVWDYQSAADSDRQLLQRGMHQGLVAVRELMAGIASPRR